MIDQTAFELVSGDFTVQDFDIESIQWVSDHVIVVEGFCNRDGVYQRRTLHVDDTPGTADRYDSIGNHYNYDVPALSLSIEQVEILPIPAV